MPKYKPKNCHCPNKKRLVSHGIVRHTDCLDVCTNPICGTSDQLTLLAPVVYDEIGINLCRVIPLTATLPTTGYPLSASAQILDVTFSTEADETTTIEPIPGRPNCSLVTLTNLSITFAITIYNSSCRVVQTLTETALYLPSGEDVPAYEYFDEETNPSNVDLEIFTPYGLAYEDGNIEKPFINYIGFTSVNQSLSQGLNMIAIPKILNFDTEASALTVGVSFYIKSIYFSQYYLPHNGRAVVPKGCILPDDDGICLDFVSGELLDYEIKPLELSAPKFEEHLKQECSSYHDDCSPIITESGICNSGGCNSGGCNSGGNSRDICHNLTND